MSGSFAIGGSSSSKTFFWEYRDINTIDFNFVFVPPENFRYSDIHLIFYIHKTYQATKREFNEICYDDMQIKVLNY